MVELEHGLSEPKELSDYRKHNPAGNWADPNFAAVRPLLRQQLNLEQEGLCIYCENLLAEVDGHIEHIQPRHLNPALTFVYTNLAHSCDASDHCGQRKQAHALPIEPRHDCNRFFALMALDGKLVPALGLSTADKQQVNDTLSLLNLNCPSLTWQRKGFADVIQQLEPRDRLEFLATAPFRWSLRGLLP